ncbi:MAG: peptide chain release factor-like protein [Myxococcales bacterium]|nr:peptide chain release factor-like protein [Myxococcales bacterium]
MHPSAQTDEALLADCEFRPGRASGPGGQHRNKTESAVTLIHRPTGGIGAASERRSQHENKAVALVRLRLTLALDVRGEGGAPSALWVLRRRGTKMECSPNHRDFPCLLAEAFDQLDASGFDVASAATVLGISSTQLVRFIAGHPPAFTRLNAERAARGLHPLKG